MSGLANVWQKHALYPAETEDSCHLSDDELRVSKNFEVLDTYSLGSLKTSQ